MVQILLATGSEQSRSLPLDAQRCINFFTEHQPDDAKSQVPLFGRPGMEIFATLGDGPARGFWSMTNVIYVVSGTSLYSITTRGIVAEVGTGIAGTNLVSMADNGTQLCIVTGTQGFIYTVAGGLVEITSAAFYPATKVIFFDGYFVFNRLGTNQFFLSALYDGLSYNGLDFASTESSPTELMGFEQNLQLLFFFKRDQIEMWYDAGTADFPFQRYAGGVIQRGCNSTASIVKQDGAIFFLGDDGIFYRLQANIPVRVSTHSQEYIIAQEPATDSISCMTWTWQGHKFVALTLPDLKRTLVYDISTQRWHDRESWIDGDVSLGVWRANCCLDDFRGETYFGDAFTGIIGVENYDVFTEYGFTISGVIYSAPLASDRKRIFISRWELDIQAGIGDTNDPVADPQFMMSYSKDGGQTFSMIQVWRSMGLIGEYLKRLRWLRLGQAYQWVFRVQCTDNVRRVIIGCYADIQIGV